MGKTIQTKLRGQTLILSSDKAIFWKEESILVLADVHLGKAMHFRKAGIPVPLSAGSDNLQRMTDLITGFSPLRIIFLGDLFHSFHNEAWEQFGEWRAGHSVIDMDLVIGNHDILPEKEFSRFDIDVYDPHLVHGPFVFSHEPSDEQISGKYHMAGHIHPAVRLRDQGRQRFKLPCFWFGTHQGLLPAFGNFTGTAIIEPALEDQVFVTTSNEVIDVSTLL
ncbi:MAG: ligase-associated DNA damage response endonuclease PdeM [Bacteroidota bacterium]